ncbi:hypothetical protein D1007_10516 [Hordeum vulgare]|nr:hypothetical protein D1007_10516 [Hordeum vulgare]
MYSAAAATAHGSGAATSRSSSKTWQGSSKTHEEVGAAHREQQLLGSMGRRRPAMASTAARRRGDGRAARRHDGLLGREARRRAGHAGRRRGGTAHRQDGHSDDGRRGRAEGGARRRGRRDRGEARGLEGRGTARSARQGEAGERRRGRKRGNGNGHGRTRGREADGARGRCEEDEGLWGDSREAKNTVKINQLLCWLKTLGVKYVCLYDIDGVLKKLFEPGMDGSRDNKPGDYLDVSANTKALGCCQRQMTIECISGSDGKEGIAKAANLLCSTFLNGDSYTQENVKSEENIKSEPVFTETDMANALKSIGCAGPEPDLLLVYGPARCHLGFPTWRLRYTEIMHMGPLKSMKYGALVKAFHNFSKKYQNYGTF